MNQPVAQLGRLAREASRALGVTSTETRNAVLSCAAELLRENAARIQAANALDMAAAADLVEASKARLKLDAAKIEDMARGLESLALLPDPLGRVDLHRLLDENLDLTRMTVPLGVIGVIFESRPDAAIQIGGLCIKSGNAALLKGGREAAHSVGLLVELLQQALVSQHLPLETIARLEDRAQVDELLECVGDVDLIIPRGSKALVQSIQARTRIPVLGHADGICHMYLDRLLDADKAVRLVRDAKLQYPAACNAIETLLVHRDIAPSILPLVAEDLLKHGAELRGCERCRAIVPMQAATEEDWDTEYGAPILSVKIVSGLDEALAHIRAHGSGHTESIVTEDTDAAARFLREVDAAGVYHNASTRFADGYRYGFGAEVGISTGRIHARGPVGLEGLVTVKYLLQGEGQIVGDYTGKDARPFLHRDLN